MMKNEKNNNNKNVTERHQFMFTHLFLQLLWCNRQTTTDINYDRLYVFGARIYSCRFEKKKKQEKTPKHFCMVLSLIHLSFILESGNVNIGQSKIKTNKQIIITEKTQTAALHQCGQR